MIENYCKSKPTKADINISRVRRELSILIKVKKRENPNANENQIADKCRQYINLKYGNDWRERGLIKNDPNQWMELSSYKEPKNFEWKKTKQNDE